MGATPTGPVLASTPPRTPPAEPGGALEAELSVLSLYPAEPLQHDLVLPVAEDARCRCGRPGTSPPAHGGRGEALGGQQGQSCCPGCSEELRQHDRAPREPLARPESDRDRRSPRPHRSLQHGDPREAPPVATFLPWGIASSFVTPAEGAGGWGAPGRSELVGAAGDSREQEQQRQHSAAPHAPCPAPPGESIKSEAPAASSQPPQHPWESLSQTPPQLAGTPRRLLPPSGKRPAAEPLRAVFQQLPRLQEAPAASWQLLDVPGGPGGSRCPPGARKQPAVSPSQVAMASFSSPSPAPPAEKRRLTIFNRIQGGNIYRLSAALEEGGRVVARTTSAVPADGSQLGGATKGLEGLVCGRGEQQQRTSLGVAGTAQTGTSGSPSEPAVPPLVIPVSVPVSAGSQTPSRESAAWEPPGGSQPARKRRRRKRRPLPQPLLIPPLPPEVPPGLGGPFQSNLRSPVLLVDHLLRELVQRSPYTPPPMLSPLRAGSGLYFSAVCSPSGHPRQLLSAVLDRMDRDFGLCLVADSAKISIEPHINVGSRFQAEIPALQERLRPGGEEQAATLVWKPWGDIATNRETQERVTALLNMACSSAMPGGGTNLELALHCLHEARGSVLEALEMLLFGGRQKPDSHPLANYRYAGSDSWTPAERQQFKKAFCLHRKDFHLIQKKIQTKNVSQCVEYYYIWKKKLKFDHGRAHIVDKKARRDKEEVEEAEEKPASSPRKRHRLLPKQRSCRKTPPDAGGPGEPPQASERPSFPCRECERVFDKIKGRNAHMKRHRPPAEPLLRIPWPLQHLQGRAGPWEAVISE
ncbi:zinc finger protein 541 isoform X2 [Anas acuta]|uniref:zinc finger protein 541 isoform X2 n=1 Tax=Anas acuta TaxID=28680 RepID=UPI0035C925DA